MAKKTRYKKLIITANALVPKGAVMERAIFKSFENKAIIKAVNIKKADDVKMEMDSIMYMLNRDDAHGCFADAQKTLDDACLDFSVNGEKQLKLLHSDEFVNAFVKELYIVPAGHPVWKDEKYIGALASVTKFLDAELYEKMKSENWETSIEGQAEEEEVEKSILDKIEILFKKMFAKYINNDYIKEEPKVILEVEKIEGKEIMNPDEVKAYCDERMAAMKAEIMAELKPEDKPEETEKEKEPEVDPEKEEMKKELEKVKADLDKEIKKSVQSKEQKEVKKIEPKTQSFLS